MYQKLNVIKGLFTDTVTSLVQNVQHEYNWNVSVTYVAEAFTGNEVAFTHIISRDIHPNQKGYLAMANSFAETIYSMDARSFRFVRAQKPLGLRKLERTYKDCDCYLQWEVR